MDEPAAPKPVARQVRHEYTRNWPRILADLRCSLLITTYQAGKLIVLSAPEGGAGALGIAYHNFEKAMGVAVAPERLAVGTRSVIWELRSEPSVAAQLAPANRHDACFLTRHATFTGDFHVHELAWSGNELWAVNTLFSCLCTVDGRHSFVPRWWPKWISTLAAEDRCHLNGLAMQAGRPRFVTLMGQTDTAGGWRPGKVGGGLVLDVPSGEAVVRGLCMPHSPRIDESGRLWLLDSGTGRIAIADVNSGDLNEVAHLPGYTRGLALHGPLAFVGLSKVRETSTFGGVPIAEDRAALRCGVAAIDRANGRQVALFEFHEGVDEIFDVQILPGITAPVLSGPYPELDDTAPIWLAARPSPLG